MNKRKTSIPVNNFVGADQPAISIDRISLKDLPGSEILERSERHNCHTFHLLEKGSISMEIDFQKYHIKAPALVYMHPDQVHRLITFKNVVVSSWALTNVDLNPEYLQLLRHITPAKPLQLKQEALSIISDAISLCRKFSERHTDRLYHSLLKDSCNALVALTISQFLAQSKHAGTPSRFEIVTNSFRAILEGSYSSTKRPAAYAKLLNISPAYLNECVKNTTGYPVSHHIQQRIILEAKRLLYHSGRSVKEIAAELGYDDYPYFSRLFTKVAGVSAQAFRSRNHD